MGWSGYLVGLLRNSPLHLLIPAALANGPYAGGMMNLPAVLVSVLVTALLVRGTKESARVNAVLVALKVGVLGLFIALSLPLLQSAHFHPFALLGAVGIAGASASNFFTFVGFDAVSTAAEETRNPQKNVPLNLLGSLGMTTLIYVSVAVGAIGAYQRAAAAARLRRPGDSL